MNGNEVPHYYLYLHQNIGLVTCFKLSLNALTMFLISGDGEGSLSRRQYCIVLYRHSGNSWNMNVQEAQVEIPFPAACWENHETQYETDGSAFSFRDHPAANLHPKSLCAIVIYITKWLSFITGFNAHSEMWILNCTRYRKMLSLVALK